MQTVQSRTDRADPYRALQSRAGPYRTVHSRADRAEPCKTMQNVQGRAELYTAVQGRAAADDVYKTSI